MHRALPDGTLFFLDTFGLTRLARDGKVKTVPQAVATPTKPFVIGGEPASIWTPWLYTHTSKVLEADTLKPISTQKSAPLTMLPDGRLLRSYGYGPANLRIVDDAAAAGAAPPLFTQETWDAAPTRPGLDLSDGATEPAPYCALCLPIVFGERLLFVMNMQLACGTITARAASLEWHAPITMRSDTLLQAFASNEEILLVRFSPLEQRGRLVRLGWDGAVRGEVTEITMVDLAAYDDGRLVYQRDADTVVVRDVAQGDEHTYSIASVTGAARAKAKKGKALAYTNPGVGKVLAGAGRIVFVPSHRESFLDLIAEEEIPRKLKAAEEKLRRSITSWLSDHRAEILDAGLLDVTSLSTSAGSIGMTFWSWTNRPTNDVVKSCVTAVAEELKLRVSSYGSGG